MPKHEHPKNPVSNRKKEIILGICENQDTKNDG
jgi:hypothetical protein